MIKIIFIFFIFVNVLFAKTLVVDNTPSFLGYFNCEGFSFSNNYVSIQDAVNNAQNGNTIKICKGDYNEAVIIDGLKNLIITNGADASSPTDVNWYSNTYTLTIGSNNSSENTIIKNISLKETSSNANYYALRLLKGKIITLNNVILKTEAGSAIYGDWNFDGEGIYKNLTINSKANGIYINKGTKQTFEDINITIDGNNANYFGIFLGDNIKNENHIFKNLNFNVKKQSAIFVKHSKNITFENIDIKATDYDSDYKTALYLDWGIDSNAQFTFKNVNIDLNKGEGINVKKADDINFDTLSINGSSGYGIFLDSSIKGKLTFTHLSLKANQEYGIYIKNGNDLNMEDANITGISGTGYILFCDWGMQGNYTFKDVNSSTSSYGFIIRKSNDITFDNLTLKGNSPNENYWGIYGDANVNGTVSIKNSDINVTGIALELKNGKPNIEKSKIVSQKNHTIFFDTNTNNIQIKDSCFYKNNDSSFYDLYVHNWETNAKVNNNCIYGAPKENLARTEKNGNDYKGNFWEGVSGDYNYNHVFDNQTLSSCPNSCSGETPSLTPIINYHMDECSWDSGSNTYEIKNFGSLENDYNASALNNADTIEDGKIYRAGDINSTASDDKAIISKTDLSLPHKYTLTTWIKFPLNTNGHKIFRSGRKRVQYFNIADRTGSNKDFIYFTKDIRRNKWTLNIDDDHDSKSMNFNPQNLSGWYMLTFVITNNGTDFYLDTNKEHTFTTHPNRGNLGLLFNSDYNSNDNVTNAQSIGASVDEFKIFDKALSNSQIQTIYGNENNGKNYDGSDRTAPECGGTQPPIRNYQFDARDIFRGEDDRNISTKIVSREFQLTLMSLDENGTKQDFNGTVCAKVESTSGYAGDYNKTIWSDNKEKNASFTVIRAIGGGVNATLYIKWFKNIQDAECMSSIDSNDTNATDNFTIRPDRFIIYPPSTQIYAGEDFNISYAAKVYGSDANASDYNESNGSSFHLHVNEINTNCINGDFNGSINFNDGNVTVTSNYNEVGKIDLNITDRDITCTNRFAGIDCKDQNISGHWNTDTDTRIDENATRLTVLPHHFKIDSILYNFDENNEFTYISQDLNMSTRLDLNVTAQNKQNEAAKNYNKNCYAKNIDINISHSSIGDGNLSKILYIYQDDSDLNSSLNIVNKNVDINITSYPKENFTTDHNGSTLLKVFINFDRNYSKTVNPFDFNITDVNVSDENISLSNAATDGNATFYFARTYTQDLATSQTDDNVSAEILVYDSADNDYVDGFKEELLDWYLINKHTTQNDGNISDSNISSSTDKTDSVESADFNTSVTFKGNGVFDISVHNAGKNEGTYFIHLGVDKWLWYAPQNFGNTYDYSAGSNCTQHPCIKYNYEKKSEGNAVTSGNTTGVHFDANVSKNSRGVRLLR
ncbi:right-handed parallel beta-helix repeat-containing protein [Sulfurimonas autotrophica]|uniref:Right handed beta helix domain-containing protein n=1 Tax=Sulfurimonas autotrophica (strain ATCC BAA-671 / DSM 16294 / JCM 11897 / OK10) TaxID=563040 RepID=E0UUZ4_SULAO|nr:right-handed parallel beta-helix repeat-containing protein [Sulfurimonas autotrophica]ADN08506.1 hypothetical protein Saut_0457 [Sulfurimonas autotrophica DSM 16294]